MLTSTPSYTHLTRLAYLPTYMPFSLIALPHSISTTHERYARDTHETIGINTYLPTKTKTLNPLRKHAYLPAYLTYLTYSTKQHILYTLYYIRQIDR